MKTGGLRGVVGLLHGAGAAICLARGAAMHDSFGDCSIPKGIATANSLPGIVIENWDISSCRGAIYQLARFAVKRVGGLEVEPHRRGAGED